MYANIQNVRIEQNVSGIPPTTLKYHEDNIYGGNLARKKPLNFVLVI